MRIERGDRDTGVAAALELLAGDPRLLVLGPVGSGRTALLTDLAAHEATTRRVWWCRGHQVGGPSGDPESLVAGEPTTLLVDDAHLLAGPVLQRILMLAERCEALDLRIVVAHRPVQPAAELAALDAALIGSRGALRLGPLAATSIDADVHARTGGWPELVAADAAGALGDLVAARIALLPDEDQAALRGACFGLPVERELVAAATVGLVHDGPSPVPAVAAAVRAGTPPAERARIATAAASAPPDVLVDVARHLGAVGDRSPEAGITYELAGDVVRTTGPAIAAELYEAAIRAGRAAADLHGRRVGVVLAAGRPEEALALAGVGPSDDAVRCAAGSGWAHLGRPDLAADCYLAAGQHALAVPPLVAAGRLDDARTARSAAVSVGGDPAVLLADGALAWASGDGDEAGALLGRGARLAEVVGDVSHWPDSPHALAALRAAHGLDGEGAEALTEAAIDRSVGGAAFSHRHRLVGAWLALRAGRTDAAVELLDGSTEATGRDAMVAGALRAAVALRGDEPEEMPAVHRAAVAALLACEPDPFTPGLAAEVAHLAARVGADPSRVLDPLDALASRLGDPPTVTVHLAWARLLVAVATDDATDARAAATQLDADTEADEPLRLLADAAARFADVLDGTVDVDAVRSVASRLVERGLVFEASRLVGAAGLRCSDPRATRTLLADLRRLRATQIRADRRAVAELSEREREVARGVLEGRTHREIGAQLYISAKTVEHHVARIRQKLGAASKAELLAAIREELAVGLTVEVVE